MVYHSIQQKKKKKISYHWEYKCDQGDGLDFLHKVVGSPYIQTISRSYTSNLQNSPPVSTSLHLPCTTQPLPTLWPLNMPPYFQQNVYFQSLLPTEGVIFSKCKSDIFMRKKKAAEQYKKGKSTYIHTYIFIYYLLIFER